MSCEVCGHSDHEGPCEVIVFPMPHLGFMLPCGCEHTHYWWWVAKSEAIQSAIDDLPEEGGVVHTSESMMKQICMICGVDRTSVAEAKE